MILPLARRAAAARAVTVPADAASRRTRRPALGVRLCIAMLGVAGVAGAWMAARLPSPANSLLPWWVSALLFFATSCLVVHIHLRHEAHTVTLVEAPLALGLVLSSPWALLLGSTVGTAAALTLVRRQPPLKLAFNLASHLCIVSAALALVQALSGADGRLDAVDLVFVALAVVLVSGVGGMLLVTAVVHASGERHSLQRHLSILPVTLAASLANTLIGVTGAHLTSHDALAGIALAVPCVALVIAYRQYLTEHTERTRLSQLYDAARAFSGAGDVDAVVRALLIRAREMLHADRAELVLLPIESDGDLMRVHVDRGHALIRSADTAHVLPHAVRDGRPHLLARGTREAADADSLRALAARDAVIAPLRGEGGTLGCLVVCDRGGDVASFDAADVALLETFAGQAATSLSHARMAAELQELAYHDPLTGLPNRALLTRRLEDATRHSSRRTDHGRPAVVYLDLDDFKTVNDSLGHAAGDLLLAEVATRLRRCLRTGDLAARLGGDEFAVLLDDVVSADEAAAVAERLLAALRDPLRLAGVDMTIAASAGVVVAGIDDHADAGTLLSHADVAMYRAKARGKGGVEVFEPSMQALVLQRHRLKVDLDTALRDGDLSVVYQPVVELVGGRRLVGVEALVRWHHRDRGWVSPVEFIPLAEETGLIHQLGVMVLEEALTKAASWQGRNPGLTMNVNVSGRQLRDPDFPAAVGRALAAGGVPPSLLQLEVTESVMVAGDEDLRRALHALRALGVRLAVDDFGTGYSSLASLRNLPVDTLKIAKPFVDDLGHGPQQDAFAAAIVGLGRTLGLTTVAEGIEHRHQADTLDELGCSLGQGYLFARPMPAAAMDELLLRGTPVTV